MKITQTLRLHLTNGQTVDIFLKEWWNGGGRDDIFGTAAHVLRRAKEQGFFAINNDGQAGGLNGGVGDTQIQLSAVWKTSVIQGKAEREGGQ